MANPLNTFLSAFSQGASAAGVGRSPLAEAKFAEDIHRYRMEAPHREAALRYTEAQADQLEMANAQTRKAQAEQAFGEFELIANERGLPAALDDPAAQQRLIRAVNMGRDEGTPELAGFERMNRRNAEQWGMSTDMYNELLASKNPNGVAEDDDEVLVPLFNGANGPEPADIDGDGNIEIWSGKQGMDFLRGRFVQSSEIAGALSDAYTGRPGGSAGSGGRQAPSQPAPAPSQPTREPQPQVSMDGGETWTDTSVADDGDQPGVRQLGAEGERASRGIPRREGESDETAIGIPESQVSEIAQRGARRVARGQGISPAQAKDIAENPEQVPEPSPRAAVAAGAQTLSGLDQNDDGGFSVSGGRRPTHKQLTSATILMRAGFLEKDDLTRYADTGQLSADGVRVIQTGMQQAAQTQRQAMSNASAERRTAMQQAGATQRKILDIAADREANSGTDRTPAETIENLTTLAANQWIADGGDPEEAESAGRVRAAKVQEAMNEMVGLRGTEWDDAKWLDAMGTLEEIETNYNENLNSTAPLRRGYQLATGQPWSISLTDNPLAIYLAGENSNLLKRDTSGFLDDADAPGFIGLLQEPMDAAAREFGAEGLLEDNPDMQRRVYDVATQVLRAEDEENPGAMNDPASVREAVRQATRGVAEQARRAGQ